MIDTVNPIPSVLQQVCNNASVNSFADFSLKSKHFQLLKKKFVNPKAAAMVQAIEFLTCHHQGFDSSGGLELNVTKRGKFKKVKTLTEIVKLTKPSTICDCLNEIRTVGEFVVREHFDPAEIDFQGKLYKAMYNRREHTIQWYRNEPMFNAWVAEINEKVVKINAKKAKKFNNEGSVGEVSGEGCGKCDGSVKGSVVNTIETESELETESEASKQKTGEQENTDFSLDTTGTVVEKDLKEKPAPTPPC